MNRLKEIKELKALAEELQLENREIIRKYKITELASIYNGIGPDSFHVRFCQATFVTFFQFFLYSKRNSPYPCNHRCRFLLKSKLIVSLFLFFKRYFLALHTGSG